MNLTAISGGHWDSTYILLTSKVYGPRRIDSGPTNDRSILNLSLVSFSFKTIFPLSPTATTLVSKDVKFYCASFGPNEKFVGGCPPTQTPTQMLKSVFSILSSQETGSSSVSLKMIFGALRFELFRFKIHSLGSKILKFPEFNLMILCHS